MGAEIKGVGSEQPVAVVTSIDRSLGFETARELAKRGMRVVATSADEARGAEAAGVLSDAGLAVTYCHLDLTSDVGVESLVSHLQAKHGGRLDVLVNDAGPPGDAPPSLLAGDLQQVRAALELHSLGPLRCCRALIPLMQKRGYGRVVNVSVGVADGSSCELGCRMGKAGLNVLTRLLSEELADSGVLVNAAFPGGFGGPFDEGEACRLVEEGVDTIVWLATLREDGPSGSLFQDCKQIRW